LEGSEVGQQQRNVNTGFLLLLVEKKSVLFWQPLVKQQR
jgi:hypothetical protein